MSHAGVTAVAGAGAADPMSLVMLSQQLPSLLKSLRDGPVGGEKDALTTVEDGGLHMGWSEQAKLVNLISRQWGSAYVFCSMLRPSVNPSPC